MFEFLFLSFLTFATTHADTRYYVDYAYQNCSTDTDAGSVFKFNLDTLLRRLSNATTDNGFNKTNVTGENPSDSVFGLFMCRADVPSQLCRLCVNKAAQQLALDCSYSQQALIWYDDCMLRYSNYSFFSTLDTRPKFTVTSILNISNEESFRRLLFRTIIDTPEEATSPPHLINAQMFATRKVKVSGFQWLYFMAQCTPYLSSNDCKICLEGAIGDLPQCCGGRQGGTVLYPSCFVRYELYPFYRHIDPSASPSHPPVLVRHIPVPASNFSNADSQYSQNPTYLYHNCSADATADSDFNEDLDTLLSYLSSNATKSYHKVSVDNNVYGLFMCRGDLPSQLCQQCVLNATNYLSSRCNSSQEAIIWFSHCMLRYSGNKFFSNMEKSPMFQVLNVTATSSPFPGQDDFVNTLSTTLATLAKAAGDSAEKYVTESSTLNDEQTLYTLGQCTQDLSSEDCVRCLTDIKGRIPWSNLGSVGGRILYPSCNIRFELFQFYRAGGDPASSPLQERKKGKSRAMISVIVPTMISLTLLSLVCYLINYYLMKRKRRKNVKTILREQFGHESVALEPFQFKLSVIEVATNNFSQENKIGRGGFGEVYKGVLDGRQIAVKRLSISSRQGENEFKNEVLSIAKLQHRNLVGFIGFCLEEQDRILIYEYVPNKSLDYFLFDSQRSKLLGWHERYNIIVGVARGILYLHEQSRLKVIHRDLKPSNILLDENMIPKISDFGLDRIVEINQDEGSTLNLAGTYGYMSPEYLAFGRFSEKSDVFSFGVMIIEIITGKKNASSYESNRIAYDLLSYV